MRQPVIIRPMEFDEIASIGQFYHDCWHQTQAPLQDSRIASSRAVEFFNTRLENWWKDGLVAETEGKIGGFVCCQGNIIEALFVAEGMRQSGIGAALLRSAEAAMAVKGFPSFSLDCLEGNNVAKAFYERNGWRIDRRENLQIKTPEGLSLVSSWLMVKP